MITSAFEQISTLQLRLKASQNEVEDFKSGAKYVQMKNQYDTDIRRLEKRLCKRDRLIAGLRIRIIKNRDMWFEQTEIVEKEHAKESQQLKKELNLMEKRALRAENALDYSEIDQFQFVKQLEKLEFVEQIILKRICGI